MKNKAFNIIKNKKTFLFLGLFSLLLMMTGVSYALFSNTVDASDAQILKVGKVEAVLDESSQGITKNLKILTDVNGLLENNTYDFTVRNTGNTMINYTISLVDDTDAMANYTGEYLPKNIIKLGLEVNGQEIGPFNLNEINNILNQKQLDINTTDTYKLRVWIDSSVSQSSIEGKSIFLKLALNAEQVIIVPELPANGAEQLINKVGTDGLVAITHPADETLQLGATTPITEYRYQGANPNNYVNFNGEDGDYRIIGVFPTEDTEGNITNRVKLIKTTNYGDYYEWNNYDNINKWGEASLKELLNDTYYNSLTNKELIDNVKYYLGGYSDYTFTNETMYQYERKISGSDYYPSGNPTSWTGQIGLMYYSDYMYGSADCNGKIGWDGDSYDPTGTDTRACIITNWLYLDSQEWTITSNTYANVFTVFDGYAYDSDILMYSFFVRPVQYLLSNVIIVDGIGTIDDPYIFGSAG